MSIQEDLMHEAARCINCKHQPCVSACPAHNHIPEILSMVKVGALKEGRALWHQTSTLGELCGVLCPHEALCEGHCTLSKIQKPVKIGWIEEQLAMLFKEDVYYPKEKYNHRHLVIGLGPAGIANAIKMAEYGYKVHCIEKEPTLGGAINTHVPSFRYEHFRLDNYQSRFDKLGITVSFNTLVGKDVLLDDLIKQYDTVFIASGLDLPSEVEFTKDADIPVYYAIDLLNKNRYSKEELKNLLGQKVGIIGLGNVSVDISRTLRRLGKEVHIIYRRTLAESPATRKEIKEAVDDGAIIHELLGPLSFRRNNQVKVLECEKTCLITDPLSSRSKVQAIEGEYEFFELDDLVFATGQKSSYEAFKNSSIRLVKGEHDYLTNYKHVYVGGDIVNKEKRIVDAMVSGQTVASLIHNTR